MYLTLCTCWHDAEHGEEDHGDHGGDGQRERLCEPVRRHHQNRVGTAKRLARLRAAMNIYARMRKKILRKKWNLGSRKEVYLTCDSLHFSSRYLKPLYCIFFTFHFKIFTPASEPREQMSSGERRNGARRTTHVLQNTAMKFFRGVSTIIVKTVKIWSSIFKGPWWYVRREDATSDKDEKVGIGIKWIPTNLP